MGSGFVSLPPTADADPDTLAGDGFFPDVDLAGLREVARVDSTVTSARLVESARNAVGAVMADLACFKTDQTALGYATLEAVPAPSIDGRSRLVSLYDRAIAELVAADLCDRLRDIGTTKAGHERADELADVEEVHRRNARFAIRDILGKPRTFAELI